MRVIYLTLGLFMILGITATCRIPAVIDASHAPPVDRDCPHGVNCLVD